MNSTAKSSSLLMISATVRSAAPPRHAELRGHQRGRLGIDADPLDHAVGDRLQVRLGEDGLPWNEKTRPTRSRVVCEPMVGPRHSSHQPGGSVSPVTRVGDAVPRRRQLPVGNLTTEAVAHLHGRGDIRGAATQVDSLTGDENPASEDQTW